MTVREALREGVAALRDTGTPFLDASLLLAQAIGLGTGGDVASLYAAGADPVDADSILRYRASLARRASGLPVAYILGFKEFWGRRFAVDERVLVPRPDTELLVGAALSAGDGIEARLGRPPRLHEAFGGSCCVVISVAADRPTWAVSASDLSGEALEVASANAASLLPADRPGGRLALWRSDILEAVAPPGADATPRGHSRGGSGGGPFDIIAANPPYVPTAQAKALLERGWHEPIMALDGGPDGLGPYRRLAPQAASRIAPGGFLLLEADGSQAEELRRILALCGFVDIETLPDLAGIPRVTRGRIPS